MLRHLKEVLWVLGLMVFEYSQSVLLLLSSRVHYGLCYASHKSNPPSVLWGIVDSYSTLPWVMLEAVTVVEGIP